jgi:hypothetical protein
MDEVAIEKETVIQSYGEFWDTFLFLKDKIDKNIPGWSKYKLSALTMACFTIEAFANHIGKKLFQSWDTIEKGIPPMGKLKMFIEMKDIEIKYEVAPFNTVYELMQWRNKIAHGKTEKKQTSYTASLDNYEDFLCRIEQPEWAKYVIRVDIEKIEKDCEELMKTIHLKVLGHLEWFLGKTRQTGSASLRFETKRT